MLNIPIHQQCIPGIDLTCLRYIILFIYWWIQYANFPWRFLCLCSMRNAAAAKSLQSCPTLCDPIDGSPPGSAVPGILQARTLEWVAISFSNAWKWKVKAKSLSRVRFCATQWTTAYQAPPSMGFFQARVLEWVATAFSIEEYWPTVVYFNIFVWLQCLVQLLEDSGKG